MSFHQNITTLFGKHMACFNQEYSLTLNRVCFANILNTKTPKSYCYKSPPVLTHRIVQLSNSPII